MWKKTTEDRLRAIEDRLSRIESAKERLSLDLNNLYVLVTRDADGQQLVWGWKDKYFYSPRAANHYNFRDIIFEGKFTLTNVARARIAGVNEFSVVKASEIFDGLGRYTWRD